MGSYLITVGQVLEELEAWNSPLGAHHSNIFWMFAVRHTKAIGLALSQALLSTSAVHVVKPDTAWNGEWQTDVYCNAYKILLKRKWWGTTSCLVKLISEQVWPLNMQVLLYLFNFHL